MTVATFEHAAAALAGIGEFLTRVAQAVRDHKERENQDRDHVQRMMTNYESTIIDLRKRLAEHEGSEEWRVKRRQELQEAHAKKTTEANVLAQELAQLG